VLLQVTLFYLKGQFQKNSPASIPSGKGGWKLAVCCLKILYAAGELFWINLRLASGDYKTRLRLKQL